MFQLFQLFATFPDEIQVRSSDFLAALRFAQPRSSNLSRRPLSLSPNRESTHLSARLSNHFSFLRRADRRE